MTLSEWEAVNGTVEYYYHCGQYYAWALSVGQVVTGQGDNKTEARDNLAAQLGVEP